MVTSSFASGIFDQQAAVPQSISEPEHMGEEKIQETESALLNGQQVIAITNTATTIIVCFLKKATECLERNLEVLRIEWPNSYLRPYLWLSHANSSNRCPHETQDKGR